LLDDDRRALLESAACGAFGPPERIEFDLGKNRGVHVWPDTRRWRSDVTGETGDLDDLRRRAASPFAGHLKELERIIIEDAEMIWKHVVRAASSKAELTLTPPPVVTKIIEYLRDLDHAPDVQPAVPESVEADGGAG
jgi:hypothetical protein